MQLSCAALAPHFLIHPHHCTHGKAQRINIALEWIQPSNCCPLLIRHKDFGRHIRRSPTWLALNYYLFALRELVCDSKIRQFESIILLPTEYKIGWLYIALRDTYFFHFFQRNCYIPQYSQQLLHRVTFAHFEQVRHRTFARFHH